MQNRGRQVPSGDNQRENDGGGSSGGHRRWTLARGGHPRVLQRKARKVAASEIEDDKGKGLVNRVFYARDS